MRSTARVIAWVSIALALVCAPASPQDAAAPAAEVSAKTWIANRDAIEAYLKTAEVAALEDVPTGVTHPRRAKLAPGGPVDAFAWKVIPPGPTFGLLGELQVRDCGLRTRQDPGARHGAADGRATGERHHGCGGDVVLPDEKLRAIEGRAHRAGQVRCRVEPAAVTGQDVRQSDWQQGSQSRELARRSRMEPDSHRSQPGVHERQGPGPQEDGPYRRRPCGTRWRH